MRIAVILLLVLASTSACYAGVSKSFLAQYANTLKMVLQADHEMFAQMQLVSRKLDQFYARHGHFPETPEEQAFFKKVVGKYIVGNPYQPRITDLTTHQQVAPEYAVPIYFLKDATMTKANVRAFLQKPPPSWQGEPGSIFVMTNGDHIYVIWAASADRQPVRDFSSAELKPRMVAKVIRQVTQ